MQEGQNAKQQVVERIRQSTSILVAVGNSPSMDSLAAALGLTLMLNKMGKHTTAVFSGEMPTALQFLEPSKTFESNVDALRDFIISLNKEKADRLRYKVEDDVVRIFITPYKTSITEKDLQYSQGDFNVDLILALGVEKRDDLDKAIVSHGRILHDATVITVNPGVQRSSLGAIDWNEAAAGSLCEMLVGLSEGLQQPGILDAQISTALLTGVVATTERFSNKLTTPRVMTIAAQLMAAGANQQLIATNLETAHAIAAKHRAGAVAKQPPSNAPVPMQEEKPKEPGELDITHDKAPEPAPAPVVTTAPAPSAEQELEAALPAAQVSHSLLPDLQKDLEDAVRKAEGEPESQAPGGHSVNIAPIESSVTAPETDQLTSHGSWKGKRLEPPTLGGTLNATTEEAREEAQREEQDDRNKTLLDHPGDEEPRRTKKRGRDRREHKQDLPTPAMPNIPVVEPPTAAPAVATVSEPVAAAPQLATAPAPEPSLPAAPELPSEVTPLPPAPTPEPEQAPIVSPPAPALELEAPTSTAPAIDLDALHNEATAAAQAAAADQPTVPTNDVAAANQAVKAVLDAQPFNPANQPLNAVAAQPMPAMPDVPVAEPLTPQALQDLPPAPNPVPAPGSNDLPPLPPMPPMPSSDTALPPPMPSEAIVPPAPDLPGLNAPVAPAPPVTNAPPTSADPGQFKIPGA